MTSSTRPSLSGFRSDSRRLALTLAGALAGAAALAAGAAPATSRLVAHSEAAVPESFRPPEICGRPFWLILPVSRLQFHSNTNPPPAPNPLDEFAFASEPMVRDAARFYPNIELMTSTNPPVVDGARLLDLANIDPRVPFMLEVRRAESTTFLDEVRTVNRKAYRRWKAAHPNFFGFFAGDEFDSAYYGYLQNSLTQNVARLQKYGVPAPVVGTIKATLAEAVKDKDRGLAAFRKLYFEGAPRFFFGDTDKLIYLHSAWCVDAYPLEWGAGCVILETTNTGLYRNQQAMTSARGAARQYGKPWIWYMAVCYNGCTETGEGDFNTFPYSLTTNPLPVTNDPPRHVRGPTCGMSPSLLRRNFFLGYLSGASMVQPETYPYAFWRYKTPDRKSFELSAHGLALKEMMAFSQEHPDRGVSYAPVALLLPYNHAQACWGGGSFSYFRMTRADKMIDAFQFTILPHAQDGRKGLEGCLANSEFGDLYDILRPNPPSGPIPLSILNAYPVAILLGKFAPDRALARRLSQYVKEGGTLVINSRQISPCLPEKFLGARLTGTTQAVEGAVSTPEGAEAVQLSEPYDYDGIELCGARPLWRDAKGGILASTHDYGRGRVVLTTVDYMVPRQPLRTPLVKGKDLPLIQLLMRRIVGDVLPVTVEGDIQYGLNKVSDGWWVYLINNKGVTKFTRTAEKLDPAASARVTIGLQDLAVTEVRGLLGAGEPAWDKARRTITAEVGPGDVAVISLKTGSSN